MTPLQNCGENAECKDHEVNAENDGRENSNEGPKGSLSLKRPGKVVQRLRLPKPADRAGILVQLEARNQVEATNQ